MAFRAGDAAAVATWTEALDALAEALAVAVLLFDPETVVLGGGLARSGDLLLDPLPARLAARLPFGDPPEVVGAALGEWAGCIGAGLQALDAEARTIGAST
jgi:glucokinase